MSTTSSQTMRAVVAAEYGSADVLRVKEIDRPSIGDTEVLIRTHAAGLDRGTWHLMTGKPYMIRLFGFGLFKPKYVVPGRDISGTVIAIGKAVTRFKVGDEVFGSSNGSFAEYASAREDKLARKPSKLSFEQAAVLGISGMTALQSLRNAARVEAGQRVLVIGASGGVGTYAVQIAKAFGAHVTGVCSTSKIELVRSIGADQVIDYTTSDFASGSERYDVIIDTGGNTSLLRLRRAASKRATIVFVGGEDRGDWIGGFFDRPLLALPLAPFVGQRFKLFTSVENYRDLESLAELSEAGKIVPAIDRVCSLDGVKEAMHDLETGKIRGKVAITLMS